MANVGRVVGVADGIVKADGLSRAGYGEQVEFADGRRGLVMNLDEDFASILVLSEDTRYPEGMEVRTTGMPLSLNVSDDLLGRVIDPFGAPLDGKPLSVTGGTPVPLERIAPGVTKRAPVEVPLKTGIKVVDALTPIGRGQRQLILGDRNTGKTALVVDTIINQRAKDLGLPQVICIYCAIGQKRGSIARTVAKLQDEGAMGYTIVVAASASTPAAMQYLAPFAACAIGEYFMERGQDALVVYDDLSRHAWAYRQISLLLARPAGREAYPGISSTCTRACWSAPRGCPRKGGGSLTALPIIQTQAGDMSAYIPTNVISITDGQIYLETDLFNAGIRPAVNAGLSVSRVGRQGAVKGAPAGVGAPAAGARAVPVAGRLLPVRIGPGRGNAEAHHAREADRGDPEAAAVHAAGRPGADGEHPRRGRRASWTTSRGEGGGVRAADHGPPAHRLTRRCARAWPPGRRWRTPP